MNRVVKMVFLTWIVFLPYYGWLFSRLLSHTMPPYPWPAIIGLTYFPLAIGFLVYMHKRMYRKELAVSQATFAYSAATSTLTLDLVWISSVEHLLRFRDLRWYAKWLGILPKDFPRVRIGLIPYPLVYFAQSSLSLEGDNFRLSTYMTDPQGVKSYANLALGVCLRLTADQVVSIRRFDMRPVVPDAIALPFIRIQTTSGDLQDFLLCAGSSDVSIIARETEKLWFALGAFLAKTKHKDSASAAITK